MDSSGFSARRRTARTRHGEFVYFEAGDGPPVLLLHGLFVSSYLWRDVVDELRAERRCIAVNLPGHGGTRVAADQDLSLPAQAEMIEAFCEAVALSDIDVVANDTGGAIAQAFAVRRPDLVRTITLTNCEARDALPSPDPLSDLIFGMAERGELAPLLAQGMSTEVARSDAGIGVGFQHPEALTEEDIQRYLTPHCSSVENARAIERIVLALRREDLIALEPSLKTLDIPALIVWGTDDRFFDIELAHWLRRTLPGARDVVEIEGGKLFWPGERGRELVPHLRAFWADVAATARATS